VSELARLQEQFHAYLLSGEPRVTECVTGTARVSAEQRLAVYGRAYRLRLQEVLDGDFQGLRTLVGAPEFERLGHAYIDAHPSGHPSLRWFGKYLSAFLARTPPYAAQPVLAEMAAFEWAQGEVFDAEDDAALSVEDIAPLPPRAWPTMRLTFHASLRRLNLDWNAPSIWQAVKKKETPPAPAQSEGVMIPWLLWRSKLEIRWRSLSADEAWAIDACMQGHNFSEVCEGLCEWIETSSAALHAAVMLKRWATDGLVARVTPA